MRVNCGRLNSQRWNNIDNRVITGRTLTITFNRRVVNVTGFDNTRDIAELRNTRVSGGWFVPLKIAVAKWPKLLRKRS